MHTDKKRNNILIYKIPSNLKHIHKNRDFQVYCFYPTKFMPETHLNLLILAVRVIHGIKHILKKKVSVGQSVIVE